MMLQQVLQSAVDCHLLTPARVGPMRTAVKQFSAMFGVSPEQLTPEQYHLPKDALFRFIEQHSAPDVGPSKLRNTKNNIRWLLDLAVREGWLRPLAGDLPHVEDPTPRPGIGASTGREPMAARHLQPCTRCCEPGRPIGLDGRPIAVAPYQRRQRGKGSSSRHRPFGHEIEAYLSWCQQAYAPDRRCQGAKACDHG